MPPANGTGRARSCRHVPCRRAGVPPASIPRPPMRSCEHARSRFTSPRRVSRASNPSAPRGSLIFSGVPRQSQRFTLFHRCHCPGIPGFCLFHFVHSGNRATLLRADAPTPGSLLLPPGRHRRRLRRRLSRPSSLLYFLSLPAPADFAPLRLPWTGFLQRYTRQPPVTSVRRRQAAAGFSFFIQRGGDTCVTPILGARRDSSSASLRTRHGFPLTPSSWSPPARTPGRRTASPARRDCPDGHFSRFAPYHIASHPLFQQNASSKRIQSGLSSGDIHRKGERHDQATERSLRKRGVLKTGHQKP